MNLISFLILLGVILLITLIHELGHLVMAKLTKVPVGTFAVGFGPNLISYEDKSGTSWCINLIPLGGYISLSTPDKSDVDVMLSISPIKRIIVALGGPLSNIITFFLIGSLSYTFIGPKTYEKDDNLFCHTDLNEIIFYKNSNKMMVSPIENKTLDLSHEKINSLFRHPISFLQSVKFCSYQFIYINKKLFKTFTSIEEIKKLRSILASEKKIYQSLTGSQDKNKVLITFLFYFILFSLNVGMFNLLPFFGLDGGWILISIINIFYKFSPKGERVLVSTLHYGTILLFLGFGLLLLQDFYEIFLDFFDL